MKLLSILRARHSEGHCDIPNLFLKPILVTLNKTFRFLPQLNRPDVTIFIVLVNLTRVTSYTGSVYAKISHFENGRLLSRTHQVEPSERHTVEQYYFNRDGASLLLHLLIVVGCLPSVCVSLAFALPLTLSMLL